MLLQGNYDDALQWLRAIRETDATAFSLFANCYLGKAKLNLPFIFLEYSIFEPRLSATRVAA